MMENLSKNYKDSVKVEKISGNADSAVLLKSKIKTTKESVGYLESVIHYDKEYTDYMNRTDKSIDSKRDHAVQEMEELQGLLKAELRARKGITEKMEGNADNKTSLKKELRTKIQTIESLEFEIEQKSLIVKMLQYEVLKRDFQQGRFKNRENLDNHIEQAQHQITESIERKAKPEKDIQSTQSDENEYCHQSFDTGHGIIIEGIFPKEFTCDVVPWTSDERLNMMNDGVLPDGYRLETDIYYVRDSKAAGPLNGKRIQAENISLKATLLKRETCEHLDYQYKGAVRFNNTWKFYEHKDDFVFKVNGVESFCVISILPEESHTICPAGSHFISTIDNGMQVRFPPNVVDKEDRISFKIHPIDMKFLSARNKQGTEEGVVCISAITNGLSSKHRKFNQTIEVLLPLHYATDFQTIEDDCEYLIFKWDDDGTFEFVDIIPVIQNNMVSFQVNSFSGCGCVRASKSPSISSLGSIVQEAYGLRMWCKILFFVGKKTNNNLPVMLECVDLQRVSDVCEDRKKYGYHFVSEWISKDFFLIPDKTIITVDVKGKFAIPKESNVKHPKLSFIPVARDNFTRFPVELKTSGAIYGVLSIRDSKGVLDEIFYDPASTRNLPLNRKIRDELLGNRNDQLVISRSPTARNPKRRGSAKKGVSDQKDDFFTEKGLLALSKLLSPDTMLDVCINLDMTTSTYETIRQKHGVSTLGNIALWKAALDQQTHNKKLENLIAALIAAGQRSLAEKVEQLHSTGQDLHKISTSTSESVMKK